MSASNKHENTGINPGLTKYREQIDEIDRGILSLMNQRLAKVQKVAELKDSLEKPDYYRPEREARILRRLCEINQGPISDTSLESLFREIMSITRASEARLSVALLGPPGTYSEAAARQHFGSTVEISDHSTIDEIFKSTETGQNHFAIVPVENSTEGGVTGTLDRMVNTTLTICGEINLQIHHNLLSLENNLSSVQCIYAHTQSLGQCRAWISRHCSDAGTVPVSSNADGARRAAAEKAAAAIAGDIAAERYGLNVIASNIEDEPGNTTRFWILSNRRTPPSGRDKTSLLLSCRSKPGALVHLLQPLLAEDIDMTKIESRPSRVSMWEYIFFVDIVGHQEEEHVSRALAQLKAEAGLYKNLGSYPAA